jgi:hypothetical protein
MRQRPGLGYRSDLPLDRAVVLGGLAIGAFGLHAVLLFFPPLPPYFHGSIWAYLLGYGAVILAVVAVAPRVRSLARWWEGLESGRRVLLAAACVAAILAIGLAVRAASPETFIRWSREEGVYEPLTLLTYLVAGMTLLAVARDQSGRDRRFLQFFGAGFFLLALEEVDYLGIVGGIVGRIDGVYVGTPHDLIHLALAGSLTVAIAVVVLVIIGILAGALLWTGYLQPWRVLRTVFSPRGLWLLAGAAFLGWAVLEDASAWHPLGLPRLEEALELAGALLWCCFGLDLASRFETDGGRRPDAFASDRRAAVTAGR